MGTILKGVHLSKEVGGNKILDAVSLEISEGEVFGIIGKSGAGKSTLLKILSSLEPSSYGFLELFGHPIRLGDKKSLLGFRKKTGMIFQNFQLLSSRTVEENIALPLELEGVSKEGIQKKVDELLPLVGLEKRRKHYIGKLSGGEKQRVAIARALINNPAVILADEPSGNLDSTASNELHKLFLRLRKEFGQTFVIVTHNKELAEMADRKLVIVDGIISTENER